MENRVFKLIQECITMIPQIVVQFRRQYFYEGNKKWIYLIEQLGEISNLITSQNILKIDVQE